MSNSLVMTEAEALEAQSRVDSARSADKSRRAEIAETLLQRAERGEVVQSEEVKLDQRRDPEGGGELPTREEFDEEITSRANLDIILGLREVEGAELVRWAIHRLSDPSGRKPTGYLAEWGTDLLSTHRIQEEFGSGTYKVVGKHSNGKYAASRTIKIAEDLKTGPVPATSTQTASENNQGAGMQEIMVMMAQQAESRRQEDLDRERREEKREDQRRRERMEMMQVLAPVAAAVLPALLGNRGPDVATLISALKPAPAPTLLETMAALRELQPAPPPAQTDALTGALKVFDALSDRMGSNKGDSGWLDVVREGVRAIAPTVGPVLTQVAAMAAHKASQQRQHREPIPSLPARIVGPPDLFGGTSPPPNPELSSVTAAGTVSAEIPSHPENGEPIPEGADVGMFAMMKMIPWLRGQLATLVKAAAKNSDPELYADLVLDQLPEDIHGDRLLEFLMRADWFQMMAQFDSNVGQYHEWFTELREEIFKAAAVIKAQVAEEDKPAQGAPVQRVPTDEIDRPVGPPSLLPGGGQ